MGVNGLLEIMRGIVTIASFVIVGRTVGFGIDNMFKVECGYCTGLGKVVCVKCRGTAAISKRPVQKAPNILVFNRRLGDAYECFVCGPPTQYGNLGFSKEGDCMEVDRRKDLIQNAICNQPLPRKESLAGTMVCPCCRGQCHLWYILPKIPQMFGLGIAWYLKGSQMCTSSTCLFHPHSNYVEWSSRPLRPISEREVGYFGDDAFDYEEQASQDVWWLMEEEF